MNTQEMQKELDIFNHKRATEKAQRETLANSFPKQIRTWTYRGTKI